LPSPSNLYAKTHYEAELEILKLANQIQPIIFRLSNAVGAPVHPLINAWNLVANDLCKQVAQKNKIVINSSGNQKRDFVTIDYLTKALNRVLKISDWPSRELPIFNIGSGKSISILDIAQLICDISKTHPEITRNIQMAEENINIMEFNCTKIQQLVGMDTEERLRDEIANTLHLCRETFV
jgi:UDP-glucose 4-epimerase